MYCAESKARFRPPDGAWIARLPQEDFCQARGVGPARKYPSDGGPTMQDCLAVLTHSERPDASRGTGTGWRTQRAVRSGGA